MMIEQQVCTSLQDFKFFQYGQSLTDKGTMNVSSLTSPESLQNGPEVDSCVSIQTCNTFTNPGLQENCIISSDKLQGKPEEAISDLMQFQSLCVIATYQQVARNSWPDLDPGNYLPCFWTGLKGLKPLQGSSIVTALYVSCLHSCRELVSHSGHDFQLNLNYNYGTVQPMHWLAFAVSTKS